MRIHGFPPIADARAHTLLLGSMPGRDSLRHGQYYAHPRNAFWPVLGALLGFDAALPYDQRLQLLRASGIAVWDVLRECHRPGSLDTDIDVASAQVNDFATFFRDHPGIGRVFFNGGFAETMYRRHVLKQLPADVQPLAYARLPSTSPAHAGRDLAAKTAAWRTVVPS